MAIRRLLVANRGEIAVRIIRTCRALGVPTVLAASAADRDSAAAHMADRTVVVGPAQPARSYLDPKLMVHAALGTDCDALHPGYGFLSERPSLARLCEDNGVRFIGPTSATIELLGDKLTARELADEAGATRLPGSAALGSVEDAVAAAQAVGFPVLLKAVAGGGGRGMALAENESSVRAGFARLGAEAREAFGDGTLYLERFVPHARHVEVQVIGDGTGRAVSLGERDCTVQRRYQKVIEEAPAVAVSESARRRMVEAAVAMLARADYRGAGTVEFVYDPDRDEAYFIEVNTRIQVEHPVTEAVTGSDIVALQLAVADSEGNAELPSLQPAGHAIEFRINAEDPSRAFAPCPGRITEWREPRGAGVRVDTFCAAGVVVTPFYDSLLAKLVVHAEDRAAALALARTALAEFRIEGIATNLPLLRAVAADRDFAADRIDTHWLERTPLWRT